MKVVNKIKEEKGAATIVEASIVFPIVFLIVCFLFFMGYYQLEKATIQMRADRIADICARVIAQPGYKYYEENTDFSTKSIDFEKLPSFDEADLKRIYADMDPYRYWGTGSQSISTITDKLQEAMSAKAYMNVEDSFRTMKIVPEKKGLSNRVRVVVSTRIEFPGFFKVIGLPQEVKNEFTSIAYVSDVSEFMRNTDIVFDLATYLDERCHISDNINDVINKMKKQFEFLGVS